MGQQRQSSTLHMLYYLLPKASRIEAEKLDDFIRTSQISLTMLRELQEAWTELKDLPMSQLLHDRNDTSAQRIMKDIVRQKIIFQYDPAWIELFFDATVQRLQGYQFMSMKELLRYLYGAGDITGMMAAKLLGLPKNLQHNAAMQARALLYLDIIAHADDNEELFPTNEFEKYGLDNIGVATTIDEPDAFRDFIIGQLEFYNKWQKQANKGLDRVPKGAQRIVHALIDISSARARSISRKPENIYLNQQRSSRLKVAGTILARLFD